MPLMWMFSSFMFVFLLFMSYYLYYIKNLMSVDDFGANKGLMFVEFNWEW
uniref:ATP synthase F0 subunit 8 n=1 Tax=Agelena silvatica TaxID=648239 RepID=A0A1P8VZ89_9ARAC|nr:ATP synthase F0 subunit 8 [Agelena silvatica]APZ84001.1 ATP synthase F0 subunit 8 [Agelena silvatica]